VAVQVPASRKGAKRSARISEPDAPIRSTKSAPLGVFDRLLLVGQKIYDKDWSVKKIYERIDDLSV
jgi:hypothetical protein